MRCTACAADNRDGAAFCDSCGAPLALTCHQCRAQLRPEARFCDSCGTAVTAAPADVRAHTPEHLVQKILRDRSAIEGERRTITVLFADATGFTSLSESLGEERVYAFTQGAVERMLGAVHRYEGTVTQFTGDGILALFGAPIAHEDSSRRAVAAGLEMQEALREYAESTGIGCRFRVGLNTGPVVVGRVSDDLSMEYTAVGDTTNLAARMEQMAEPGSVYLTATTQREVADYFDLEDLGPQPVKGKSELVHVYKALRERGVRSRMDAAIARGLSPFVGRDRELGVLEGLWREALDGRGQIVLISGEPGIGKSRLLLEFRRVLGPDVIWREAHCVTYGETIPYLPVVELVKSGFGVTEADDDATIIRRVDDDTALWSPEAQKTVPYLKFLLQVDPGDAALEHMDPMARRAGILDALRALVLERARVAPRVVIVEDLHWADAQSEEAFRVCTDVVAASPVLMILTFRPGYLHPSADLPNAHRIILSELDSASRRRLASATLEAASLSADLADPVTRKAEGNPLFIEEVTKALAAGAADANAVPNSLQDVILARIDRLERSARESLQLASVIGREFTLRLLNRISDLESELEGVLSDLKMLELIYEKAFFPELAYMFKHALTHDVAYSTLLLERRKTLHRVVAIAIEELYGDRLSEHHETLAHHYLLAEEWPKALDYLEKAADKAAAAFANQEAFGYAARAIEVCERLGGEEALGRLARLAEMQGVLGFTMGDLDASAEGFRLMGRTARELGDARTEGLALGGEGLVQVYRHEMELAEDLAVRALSVAPDDLDVGCSGRMVLWCVALFTNQFEEARSFMARVLEDYPKVTHGFTKSMSSWSEPLTHEWAGQYERAIDAVRRVEAGFGSEIDLLTMLLVHWSTALARASQGRYQEGLDLLLEDLSMSERVGVLLMSTRQLNTVGFIYGELEDYQRALEWNHRGLQEALAAGFPDPEIESNARLNIGDCLVALGRPDEAEEQFAAVERIYRDPTPAERFMLWRYSQHMLHSYGGLWLARGDPEKALAYADECLELAQVSDSAKNVAKARRLRGQALAALGSADDGAAEIEAAIDVAQGIGNATQLWKSHAALGDLRFELGREDDARTSYAAALEVIDRIASGLTEERLRDTYLESERVSAIRARA